MILNQSKSINHSVSPKEATSVASLKGTVTLELKKKTLHQVYNQVKMCEELGFPNFSKGEPINNLMSEIRKQVKKQMATSAAGEKIFWAKSEKRLICFGGKTKA